MMQMKKIIFVITGQKFMIQPKESVTLQTTIYLSCTGKPYANEVALIILSEKKKPQKTEFVENL
jgi:hypothetical protein